MVVNASGVLYDDIGVSLTAVLQTVSEKENCYNRGVKIKYRPKNMSCKNRKKTICRVVVGLAVLIMLWIGQNGCCPTVQQRPSLEKTGIRVAAEPDSSVVAYVNGVPISEVHLRRRMRKHRALVHSYFNRKYNAQDHPDFWTTSYGGEIPLEVLRQRTLEQCVRIKVKQLLGKEKGLVNDISYGTFLQNLKDENERRKIAVANGEVIYGPVQYRELYYFDYLMDILEIDLMRKLAEVEFLASDETLRRYYDLVKDKLYKREDDIRIQSITIPFSASGSGLDRTRAREAIETAQIEIRHDVPFEEAAKRYNPDGMLGERFFGRSTARTDSISAGAIKYKQEASKLSPCEVSRIFEANSAFHIIKCVEREQYGHEPFENVRQNVRTAYVSGKYRALVDNLVKKAEVRINKEVFNRSF